METKKSKKKVYSSTVVFDKNFQDIVQFYLFECPVDGVSHRGTIFKNLGWYGSSRFQMLERLLKAASCMNDSEWSILDTPADVRKKSAKVTLDKQFIFSDQSKGRVPTFIYSIRNAFAHGSFDLLEIDGKRHYLIENEYRGNLRTKMVLSEDTLICWIKILKTKPEYLTKKAQERKSMK